MSGRSKRARRETPEVTTFLLRATRRATRWMQWWGDQMRAFGHRVRETTSRDGFPGVMVIEARKPVVPLPRECMDALVEGEDDADVEDWAQEDTMPGTVPR